MPSAAAQRHLVVGGARPPSPRLLPPSLGPLAAGAATLCAVLGVAPPALAEGAGGGGGFQVVTLVTAHRFTGDEPRADPDQPSLRYGLYGLRWKAMAGEGVVLVGGVSEALHVGLALDGFVELVNFDEGGPVPWQSYRANVGAEVLLESPRL